MIITKDNWNDTRWPNFTPDELACKHCGALEMDADFLDEIQHLRNIFGAPMTITSGYRCPNHPAEINKKTSGAHPQGKAIDVAIQGPLAYRLIDHAFAMQFDGIGIAEREGNARFVHLDKGTNLPRPTIWSY